MFKLIQQKGSSTVGLLTASTIFIGLLVYANQFAFNNNEDNFFSSFFNNTPETVTKQPVETVSGLNTHAIQPSSQGIFDTATITSQDLNEVENSELSVEIIEHNSEPSPEVVFADSQQVFKEDNENGATQPYTVNYYANQGYADQAALASYQYQNAGFNHNQQYYSTTRANSRGNGRGKMNSDGEFNFSMSFKARGRMDTDSDFEGNMATDGNAYQQYLYNANAVSYPAYSYGYYSY